MNSWPRPISRDDERAELKELNVAIHMAKSKATPSA